MIEKLESVFLYLINKNITISIVVLCILVVRWLLKRYPRKYSYPLWAALGAHIIGVKLGKLVHFDIFPTSVLTDGIWNGAVYTRNAVGSQASVGAGESGTVGVKIPVSSQTALEPVKGQQGVELLRIAAVIWLIGLVLFCGYFLISYIRMSRRVRFGIRLQDNIFECDTVASPFVMGVFRPRIYLPVRMTKEQQAYVICHEQYHIRRKDYLIKLLAFFLLGIYWYHPMMWAAYFSMCRDMEMSCDEHVLELQGLDSRRAYSIALLDFASGKRLPGNLLGFGEHEAQGRIKNILRFRIPGRWARAILPAVCIVVFVILGCSEIAVGKDAGSQQIAVEKDAGRGTEAVAAESVSEAAERLYGASTLYVGDASAVGNLLKILTEYDIMPDGERTMELFTDEKPYGMAVHFAGIPEDEDGFTEKMYSTGILCWALIENLEDFQWSFPAPEESQEILTTYYLDETALKAAFPGISDIKEYGKSAEGVQELMKMIGLESEQKLEEIENIVSSIIGGASGPTSIFIAGKVDRTDMDAAINACLLQKKRDAEDVSGNFQVYAHVVQDAAETQEQEDGVYKLHLWTMYHEYDYDTRNGLQMLKNETKPVYMELKLSEQGEYQLLDYIEWMEENRGEEFWKQFSWDDKYRKQMFDDCQKQAEEYSEMIAEVQEAIDKEG